MAVLPQLLSPHAEKRPKELYRLKEHLKGTTQTPAKTQPDNKPKPRKRFDVVRFGLTTFFAVALFAGVSWFGYQGFLKYDADRKGEAERMNAELKRQIAEQKETSQKIAAEQKRLRDEAARQKAAVEKIEATVTTQIVTQIVRAVGHGFVAGHDAPTAAEQVETSKTNKPKTLLPSKEKMVVVGKVEEHVDYGPIPQVKYKWFTGDNALIPNKVAFALANKSTIDLVPMRKGSFLLLNPRRGLGSFYLRRSRSFDDGSRRELGEIEGVVLELGTAEVCNSEDCQRGSANATPARSADLIAPIGIQLTGLGGAKQKRSVSVAISEPSEFMPARCPREHAGCRPS